MLGIISAMPEEINLLLSRMIERQESELGMRKYYRGKIFGKDVVLTYSRIGKVAAAATVITMILNYNVEKILFSGVAGSISRNFNIGDVIIAKRLIQHDMDASPIFPKFEIPLLGKSFFETDIELSRKLLQAANIFVDNIRRYIPRNLLKKFNIQSIKVSRGDIASGDQFISDKTKHYEIKQSLPSVVCVEMEGAAVAQVCYEYSLPFAVLRTISDNADHNAEIDFNQFLKTIASRYSTGILEILFSLI